MGIQLYVIHYAFVKLCYCFHDSICAKSPHLVVLHRKPTVLRPHQHRQLRVVINKILMVLELVLAVAFQLRLFLIVV